MRFSTVGVGLYKSLLLLLLTGRIGPWLDCGAEVTACRVSARLGPQELHLNGLMMILVDCWQCSSDLDRV